MSALARYLNSAKVSVTGYDKTPTSLTDELIKEGISIHFEDKPDLITNEIDLVIYTPAIPKDLEELNKAKQLGLSVMKRSQLLEMITANHSTLAVAGTHGKTTVSTMLAHILYSSEVGCTAFLGGIAKNYNSNLLLNLSSNSMVAEADEFDRSFLKLHPRMAVITSTDADHLDIYQNHENLLSSFAEFVSNIEKDGYLLIKAGISLPLSDSGIIHKFTYSLAPGADFYITDLKLLEGRYQFNLQTPDSTIQGFYPSLPGLFNVENAIAAASAAYLFGIDPNVIVNSINNFIGVKRRFDHRINKKDFLFIDDYAHHPEELKACINSVKKIYPERKITGIFQPHLYTRTRDFAQEFAQSLSLLDNLILLDIYPARELPIEGINSQMLLDITPAKNKILLPKGEVINYLKDNKPDILLTLGAGDIDKLVPEIEEFFS